jgi:N-acetylglucosaminyldiphosphoundecaprenol N-acetyl-beta-D-mannosaminyltransferase
MKENDKVPVADVRFDSINFADLSNLIQFGLSPDRAKALHIHFANAWTVSIANRSNDLLSVLNQTDSLVIADGKSIVFAAKFFPSKGKVTQSRGPSFFREIIYNSRNPNLRHYFLGGTKTTLDKLACIAAEQRLNLVGCFSPPFRQMTSEEREVMNLDIKKSKADIVWVGLGTPRQDFEAFSIARNLNTNAICVGAAFDFIAGDLHEAPKLLQSFGLEWLYRLLQEPRRLFTRYFFGIPHFIFIVIAKGLPRRIKP